MFATTAQASTNQSISANSVTSATSVSYMDELVKEYLIFRGSTAALKAFENDLKQDKDRLFKPEKLVDQIFSYIHSYDLNALLDFWSYLEQKYFSQITVKSTNNTVLSKKFELSIMRYYLVNAVKNNRNDKATEFFEKQATALQLQPEWKEWFCLPFVRNPEENTVFSIYFNKTWLDTFSISLQNFFSIVFQSIQFPRLLHYDPDDAFWNQPNPKPMPCNAVPNNEQDFYNQELTDEIQIVQHETMQPSGQTLLSRLKSFGTISGKDRPPLTKTPSNSSQIVGTVQHNASTKAQSIKSPVEAFIDASRQNFSTLPLRAIVKGPSDINEVQKAGVSDELFDSKGSQAYETVSHEKYIHEQSSSVIHCKYSNDGKNLVSANIDGSMKSMPVVRIFTSKAKNFKIFAN